MRLLLLAAVAACLTVEAQPVATPGVISGKVQVRPAPLEPVAGELVVSVQDVSRADARSIALGEQRLPATFPGEMEFEVRYDPASIQPGHRYTVSAQVRDASGKLLYITDRSYPVIGSGVNRVDLVMRAVGAQQTVKSPVEGLWELVEIQYMNDTVAKPEEGGRYAVEFLAGGQASIQTSCNNGKATYTVEGSALKFGPIATTRRACPPSSIFAKFLRDLEGVRSYVIRDGNLFLAIQMDTGIMKFRPAGR